jgi:hypothetical protein
MERPSWVFEIAALVLVSMLHSEQLVHAILLSVQGNSPSVLAAPSEHLTFRLAAADE